MGSGYSHPGADGQSLETGGVLLRGERFSWLFTPTGNAQSLETGVFFVVGPGWGGCYTKDTCGARQRTTRSIEKTKTNSDVG